LALRARWVALRAVFLRVVAGMDVAEADIRSPFPFTIGNGSDGVNKVVVKNR